MGISMFTDKLSELRWQETTLLDNLEFYRQQRSAARIPSHSKFTGDITRTNVKLQRVRKAIESEINKAIADLNKLRAEKAGE